jgi:hypothetical protein
VPQSDFAFQYPQDGENYIGLVTYEVNSGGIREYAMVQLTEPLVQGQLYTVRFYANAAWNGTDSLYPQHYIASSHIGALFTMQPRPWSSNDPWPMATGSAHVWHPWVIVDTVNWILVSGSFLADSAYHYLMIGNHFDNSVTDTISLGSSIQLPKGYTLIDNVCVSQGLEGCPSTNGVGSHSDSEVVLLPNPAIDELVVMGGRQYSAGTIQDATGRLIWRGRIEPGRWALDVKSWARGYYVLSFRSGDDRRSFKFVLIE